MPGKRQATQKRRAARKPPPAPVRERDTKGGGRVYAQAVFAMKGDGTVSFTDDQLAILDHGNVNLPIDFPAMIRLHQLVADGPRAKVPKGWVIEIDWYGTTFAIRAELDTEEYRVFVKHPDENYRKVHTEPKQGAN